MKLSVIALLLAPAAAFVVPPAGRGLAMRSKVERSLTQAYVQPGDNEEEGMDLNLEEMFEIFDAADDEISNEEVGMEAEKDDDKKKDGKDGEDFASKIMGMFGGN
eukprot:CAMPEP_0118867830 /NCGR_PEP_ID=MMETSP1163-20130328/11288_1 /TAXON_ID=124430 /ORGANISM="Phaeomonas parva, Strain CCMP2877" /LENGTH=104 /DNA_ID=CAMNT_0006802295 /DNA_START=69 /DNA_END=383 /DNA_ORIENTATION=-